MSAEAMRGVILVWASVASYIIYTLIAALAIKTL